MHQIVSYDPCCCSIIREKKKKKEKEKEKEKENKWVCLELSYSRLVVQYSLVEALGVIESSPDAPSTTSA